MGKGIGRILVLLVAGALMLYSGSRTFHLLSSTLPAGQEILAVIALAAFDIGLVAWLLVFLRGAEGGLQRGISLLMVIVDLIGVVIGFMGDTLLTSGQTGILEQMAQSDRQTIILLTAGIVGINIAGTIFFHLADPGNQKRMATEAAKDQIEEQSLNAIKQQAALLAAELAPTIASDWVLQMRAQFTGSLADGQQQNLLNPPPGWTPPAKKPSLLDKLRSSQPPAVQPPPQIQPAQTMASEGSEIPKSTKRQKA